VDETKPDVLVTALRLPPSHSDEGLALATEFAGTHPNLGVVILSRFIVPSYALALFDSGNPRRAYISKSRVDQVRGEYTAEVIRNVSNGIPMVDTEILSAVLSEKSDAFRSLTTAEEAVLAAVADGDSNRAIADRLGLTSRAVERQLQSIFQKLGLTDDQTLNRRVLAAVFFAERGSRDSSGQRDA
jgi:DNA-binding NarL/FixJ family response regulator